MSVFVCMCVFVCVCLHIYAYVYMVHTFLNVCRHIFLRNLEVRDGHLYICKYIYQEHVCVCVCVCYIRVYKHTHLEVPVMVIYTYAYISRMCVCVCVCVCVKYIYTNTPGGTSDGSLSAHAPENVLYTHMYVCI